MAVFIKSATNPTAPLATNPYVEKDFAIVRGTTLALFDLSNIDCYASQATPVKGGDTFTNLVAGGGAASLTAAATVTAPYATGLIRSIGQSGSAMQLPATFLPSTSARRILVPCWLSLAATGWPANASVGIIGAGTGSNASAAHQTFFTTDGSGAITAIRFRCWTGSANMEAVLTGTALTAALGGLHQFGFAAQIVGGVGQAFIYVDGVVAANSGTPAMTQFNQSGGLAYFGFAPGATGDLPSGAAGNTKWGRPSFHDLTSRADLTFAALLARDIDAAAGYLA